MPAARPFVLTAALALWGGVLTHSGFAEEEFFQSDPIAYSRGSSRDAMGRLAADWAEGKRVPEARDPLGFLRALLADLKVPEASQVVVFSKTSKQNTLISPTNPRAVYFSDDTYVGYVPGGLMEVVSCDPDLGPVFYRVEPPREGRPPQGARDDTCLSCHASARTEGVPGLMVRSVFTKPDGHPILSAGTFDTTQASPLEERWGGWFVTGQHGRTRHMGNATVSDASADPLVLDREAGANWPTLEKKIDTTRYLRPTSDLVALMVLEHQCRVHNLMTKAAMEFRRAGHLQKAVDPGFDPAHPSGTALRVAEADAETLVRAFLFEKEASLGEDGVQGGDEFVQAFQSVGQGDEEGRSLRKLRLEDHLFKYRCSYMVQSSVFRSLPEAVRRVALDRLRQALEGRNNLAAHLPAAERTRLIGILAATGVW